MKNKSFVLYNDYENHITLLTDQEAGQLFKALFAFVERGELPNFSGGLMMCFSFISAQLERDREKYIDVCNKRAEAGKKGGLKKQANLANARNEKQNLASLADTDNNNNNETNNETIKYICSLLNEGKAKSNSKGRLKSSTGEWTVRELLQKGISEKEIINKAKEIAESGLNVDWFKFKELF